ncbi:FtsK/SpoIIIE domain-containing protein [Saccharopolyspora griseoalba]|uniref:FtsK/SpoIIIE domain-containing protein n=1 Tax=Saccharopolyspora griseoalba TaxID=1431848 RepID=A0ABW2LV00_9PSEU
MQLPAQSRQDRNRAASTEAWRHTPRQSPLVAGEASTVAPGVLPFGDTPPSADGQSEPVMCGWDISTTTTTPHLLVTGSTGSGLSTALRSIAVSATSQHCDVVAMHAGGLVGLNDLEGWPGVRFIGRDAAGFASALEVVHTELHARYEALESSRSSEADPSTSPSELTPLVLLVDAWSIAVSALRDAETVRRAFDQLRTILGLGRFVRVHVALSNHRLDPEVLPGELLDQFAARVALGRLSPATLLRLWDLTAAPEQVVHEPGWGLASLAGPHSPEPIRIWTLPHLHQDAPQAPSGYASGFIADHPVLAG